MLKRSLAFVLSICLIATMLVVPAITASAEVLDLTDYEPVPNGTYLDGKVIKITSYNGTSYDYGVEIQELENSVSKFYTKDTRATIPNSVGRPQGGLEYDLTNKPIEKGDKLVFMVKVRKVNDSDVVPNLVFGLADASMGGSDAGWGWKAQTVYTHDVTSTDWEIVMQEIEIPYNGTANTKAVLGLGVGCTFSNVVKGEELGYKGRPEFEFRPGAAVEIDFNSVYLGKLSAYDINFELSASEAAVGETLTGSASIVDRAGLTDGYDQNFTYYVTDPDGNVVDGFQITEPQEGEVAVKIGTTVAPGSYVVLAKSDEYAGFQKTAPIEVVYGKVAGTDGSEIVITTDDDTVVGVTDKFTFAAEVQKDGSKVDYDGTFAWSAIGTDKISTCDDISFDVSDDSTSAVVSLALSISEGNYYIMVTSGDMCSLLEITVDKSGDIQNIITKITEKKTSEIADNLETYLAVLEISDTVAKDADAEALANALASTSEDEDITDYDIPALQEYVVRNAVVSLYNKNENNIELSDENGAFTFADVLKLADIDKDGATLWQLFGNIEGSEGALLSAEGKTLVHKALTEGAPYASYGELVDKIEETILLYTLAYPDVLGFGYVDTVLTDKNLELVGIDGDKYLGLSDNSYANETLAGTLYTAEELEEALGDVTEPEEEEDEDEEEDKKRKPTTGGGGGGFIGGFATTKNEETDDKASANYETRFTDLPDTHWACTDIYFLKEIGVINGTTEETFDPEGVLTREQFLKMLVLAFKVPAAKGTVAFGDVDGSAWYAPYVGAGYENGIVNGLGDGSFGIGKTITRQDACVMLARALGVDTSADVTLSFSDADSVAGYAKGSVASLVEYAIVNGFDDNSFRANEICSRAQAAKIVSNAITIFNSIRTGGSN